VNSVSVIAEAGVNHNGKRETALQLIDAAIKSGADTVKFQTFNSKEMTTSFAKKAKYQIRNTKNEGSQQSMLERLELSYEDFECLYDYSKSSGISFLSTAFDFSSLSFIVNSLNLETLKIASGEMTNAPFVLEHARSKKNLILSTGMATISEIINSLGVIAFGLTSSNHEIPKRDSFKKAFKSKIGQESLSEKVTLLHCVTDYPPSNQDLNLNVIRAFKEQFKMRIGYSDHSDSVFVPSLAVACGAEVIEKHITLDQEMNGPDHRASLEPNDFLRMVDQIRITESILGKSDKIVSENEIENRKVSRKSLFAGKVIKKGEKFTDQNIAIRRPELGRDTYDYWKILNKTAKRDYSEGEILDD